jgi:lipoprotein-anchoring transpeptidase ErfK/SrfK
MPRKYLLILLPLLIILIIPVIIQSLKSIALKQDSIDPENIKEDYKPNLTRGIFNNKIVEITNANLVNDDRVLGDSTLTKKRIEINLTEQRLFAYEDNIMLYSFVISSGKWNSTPTGVFKIWTKVRSQKMSGGSKELGTYYYLPNVPYIMFFYNETTKKSLGYSLHGTYWHNNFGKPMSHGCINMITKDAKTLYSWADFDTPIIIYGKYSSSLSLKSSSVER